MKNKIKPWIVSWSSITTAIYITFMIIVRIWTKDLTQILLFVIGTTSFLLNLIIFIFSYINVKKRKQNTNISFDNYLESMSSLSGIGLISFNENEEIVWMSDFLISRMDKNFIGRKITDLSENFAKEYQKCNYDFTFDYDHYFYNAKINLDTRTLILKDVTEFSITSKQYFLEQRVIGEVEIDNFQHYQIILSQEELFRIQSQVIDMLDGLVEKYNFTYRQYVNGKFIIMTDQETLNVFIETRFDFMDKIRKVIVIDGVSLSISIGLGCGTINYSELAEQARDGLMQAQARGGDQVGLIKRNYNPRFFGSRAEIAKTLSKVRIKKVADALQNRLIDKKIKNVIIYGHDNADLDAIGSALGIVEIIRHFNKKVYIQNVNWDKTTKSALESFFTKEEIDELFIKPVKAKKLSSPEETIVILTDVSDLERVENPQAIEKIASENIFVFDHHRIGKLNDKIKSTNVYSDTSASSASEIIVEVISFLKTNIKIQRRIAQMLLHGIYLDTMQFQKSTSSRTFDAAAKLEKLGASSSASIDVLKISEEEDQLIRKAIENVNEIKPGYFMATYEDEVPSYIISKATDELLRTHGRKAAFVVAKLKGTNMFKLSARGIDTNVQVIAESVGGGGNFSSAAATSKESFDTFVDNIKQAIVSHKRG